MLKTVLLAVSSHVRYCALSSDAMCRYYILVIGDVQIRCLSHNCFFLLCCSFSSLLINIGILVVHCRNLASALFLLLLPSSSFFFFFLFLISSLFVFYLFSVCLFVTYASLRTRLRPDRLLLSLLVCIHED